MSDSAPDGSAAAEEPNVQAPQNGQSPPPRASRGGRNQRQQGPTVVVRYGLMRQIGEFRHNQDPPPSCGAEVVVRTERGVELGRVITRVCDSPCGVRSITPEHLDDFVRNNGADFPFRRGGKLLRMANQQDMIDHRHLETSAREEAAFCREQIRELKLAMKLVSVEHVLGGGRIIFYFASEGRVDFRKLVQTLAGQYHTRIEMKQVGARDEARLVADYERCGRRCCCQQFLKDLRPVAMRMAKTQKATLDPSKISGRCGRLMCCLRYEDATYDELRKKLPKRNTWVRTAGVVGKVVETHILTQLVRLSLQDSSTCTVTVDEIIERDISTPPPPAAAAQSRRRQQPPAQPPAQPPPQEQPAAVDVPGEAGQDAPAPAAADDGQGSSKPTPRKKHKKRSRSRRSRKKSRKSPPQSK